MLNGNTAFKLETCLKLLRLTTQYRFMNYVSRVRVKRKGQVTIPMKLRSKLGIEEGTLLEIKEENGKIVMKPTPRIKAGKVVGEEEYKKIICELDGDKINWR
jgi:AbrB family looped-hinge helix DNA binding protein